MKDNKKYYIVKPHFRWHKKKYSTNSGLKNHPALIVGSNDNEYAYNSLTHSSKSSNRKNRLLSKNPNSKDNRKVYLRKEVRSDSKGNFRKVIKHMKLDPKDEREILDIIKRNKHFN